MNLYQFEWHAVSTDVVLSTCLYAISFLSLGLTSSQKVSLFPSIEFLQSHYRKRNLMMEWLYKYVVR